MLEGERDHAFQEIASVRYGVVENSRHHDVVVSPLVFLLQYILTNELHFRIGVLRGSDKFWHKVDADIFHMNIVMAQISIKVAKAAAQIEYCGAVQVGNLHQFVEAKALPLFTA